MKLPFDLLIIRHWREARKHTNSGKLVSNVIDNVKVVDLHSSYKEIRSLIANVDGCLLFPQSIDRFGNVCVPSREGLPSPLPKTVIIVDGTWSEAHNIAREISMPRFTPKFEPQSINRLLRPPTKESMATAEAVALMIQEVDSIASALLLNEYKEFVNRINRGIYA